MVRIREPLTAQQLETTTERWLVIDPVPASMPTVRPLPISSPGGDRGAWFKAAETHKTGSVL